MKHVLFYTVIGIKNTRNFMSERFHKWKFQEKIIWCGGTQ